MLVIYLSPQRLIAFFANQIHLPAAIIPYFYTWTAITCTGLLVGVFCLSRFRVLVRSDALRFFVAISVLMVADFETRTFINFTYFSAFFIAIITALALADGNKEVPKWAWLIPVLMISKPAVLATLPAMIIVALISRARFRAITIVTTLLCVGQILQIILSAQSGVMPSRLHEVTIASRFIALAEYFFGFLGGYVVGPSSHINKFYLMLIGSYILGVSGYIIFKRRNRSGAMILVGLSLLFFNILLNVFALSDYWNQDLSALDGVPVYRHIIIGFYGSILVVAGVLVSLIERDQPHQATGLRSALAAFLYIAWFIGVGWCSVAIAMTREPSSPTLNNSQWQIMAQAIDSQVSPLCVPIDPWWKGTKWIYQRDCSLLNEIPTWDGGTISIASPLFFDLKMPTSILGESLISAAVLIKPISTRKSFIEIQMMIKLTDGGIKYFSGSREVDPSGALLLVTGKDSVPIKNITSIRLIFNMPVEIAMTKEDGVERAIGIAWMGN